jgi:uncharacterized membrane protein YoaK (UPF0700 family)
MQRLVPVSIFKLADRRRTPAKNWQLGLLLAFIAGYINAGGFFLVGRYTSHMTGILSAVADDAALGLALPAAALFGLIICFIAGAAFTTLLVLQARRRRLASQYSFPLLIEAFLLVTIVLLSGVFSDSVALVPFIAAMLCFLMGLQNALITKASTAVVRTTHVTGLSTDLGIEIGRWLAGRARRADLVRMVLYLSVFIAFLLGGICGALIIQSWAAGGLLPVAGLLLLLGVMPAMADLKAAFGAR